MAGYLIVLNSGIIDKTRFEEFRKQVESSVKAQGGRYLVRGSVGEVIEGEWIPDQIVVLEFDDVEEAKAWAHSAEYAELNEFRKQAVKTSLVIVAAGALD